MFAPLRPLEDRVFRSFWLAVLVANLGGFIQTVGAAWLMTTISTSAVMVALVQSSAAVPGMILSILAGAVADNFDRRKMMLIAQCIMLLASVALVVTAYANALTQWTLLFLTFAIGIGTALHYPSWQAAIGDLVARPVLPAAVGLNAAANNVARGLGPSLGGLIVAIGGPIVAFFVNAACYIGLIVVLWRWKYRPRHSGLPREGLGQAMGAGLRYAALSPNIQKLLLRSFIFSFAASPVLALLPLIARDILSGQALLYGLLFGSFGLGAVCGGLLAGTMLDRFAPEQVIRLSSATLVSSAAAMSISPFPWLTGVAFMLAGASWIVTFSSLNVFLQSETPRWVIGRVFSLFNMSSFGGLAIGSWTWGVVANEYGPGLALQLAAAAMLAGTALGVGRLALPALSSLNLDPLDQWREPELQLNLTPRSGPVRITIEYLIPGEGTSEFTTLMVDRKRIRQRNGARRWSLVRDLQEPTLWIESFQFATWIEYIRHAHRTTQADAAIGERLQNLHAGSEPPRIRRLIERPPGRYADEPSPSGLIEPH